MTASVLVSDVINKGPHAVLTRVRARPSRRGAVVSRLVAPLVTSRRGVTLAGQWIGPDAHWHGTLRSTPVHATGGVYSLRVDGYSAALVRIG